MDTADTKTLLMDAAKTLFAKNGFNGTSVKEICELAGVNVSLISYHFGSKEGLYRACLETFGTQKLESAKRTLVAPKSIEEMRTRLMMYAEEMMRCHVDDPQTTRMVQRAMVTDTDISHQVFEKTFVQMFQILVGFMTNAQGSGLIRNGVDPFMAASAFTGPIMHLGMTEHIRVRIFGESLSLANEEFRRHALDQIVGIFLRGIV